MKKLKKWDPIIVVAWSHKWVKSKIVKLDWDRVYLHNVNKAKKAVKGQWFVEKELSIHVSNISYLEWETLTKIAIKIDEKTGKKLRVSKKTLNNIPEKSRKI